MTNQEIATCTLLDDWVAAINRRDITAVTALYHPQAQFWGTLAGHLRTSNEDIGGYYRHFLDCHRMQVEIDSADLVPLPGGLLLAAGAYRFCWQNTETAAQVHARARFSMVFGRDANRWQIRQHHSSGWIENGI